MKKNIKNLFVFDFDKTLMQTPEEEEGKKKWSEVKGEEYKHKGWWSKKESLDLDVFDIKPYQQILKILKKEVSNKDSYVIILTNRREHLRPQIQAILDKHKIVVDELLMRNDNGTKGDSVVNLVKRGKMPNLETIKIYDDFVSNVNDIKDIQKKLPDNVKDLKTYLVKNGKISLKEYYCTILTLINEEIKKII